VRSVGRHAVTFDLWEGPAVSTETCHVSPQRDRPGPADRSVRPAIAERRRCRRAGASGSGPTNSLCWALLAARPSTRERSARLLGRALAESSMADRPAGPAPSQPDRPPPPSIHGERLLHGRLRPPGPHPGARYMIPSPLVRKFYRGENWRPGPRKFSAGILGRRDLHLWPSNRRPRARKWRPNVTSQRIEKCASTGFAALPFIGRMS
jgi:hypothetical protein